jgi:hypothetical protein
MNQEHLQLMSSKISPTLATALFIVYLERAEQLPSTEHGKSLEPSPFCSIKVDNYEEKTALIKNCTNPRWMKSFMFMLVNPEQSLLQVNINDSSNKNHLIGTVELSIKSLMAEKDWTANRAYPLKNSLDSKLYMKVQLQLMTKVHPSIDQVESPDLTSTDDTQSYSSLENLGQKKKSKIQIHLVNRHTEHRLLTQSKSPVEKKSTLVQRLLSSCIKKPTATAATTLSNNFSRSTYGFW